MKVSELEGVALDWAVAKAKGYADFVLDSRRFMEMHETGHYNYSTDWAQGGPIIEREKIDLSWDVGLAHKDGRWRAEIDVQHKGEGPTPLIAAMRCYVADKLGDEIELPKELMSDMKIGEQDG